MKNLTRTWRRAMLLVATLTTPAMASALDVTGLYLGGNFGRARNEYDTSIFDTQLNLLASAAGAPLTIERSAVQRLADLWWVDAGYFFTPYVGAELSFIHAGQVRYFSQSSITLNGAVQTAYTTQEVTSHGPAISVVGRLPLTERFEVDLRIGDYVGKTQFDQGLFIGSFTSYSTSSKTTSSLLAGVGLAVTVGSHWSLRADFLRFNKTGGEDIQKFSINAVTGGISYVF